LGIWVGGCGWSIQSETIDNRAGRSGNVRPGPLQADVEFLKLYWGPDSFVGGPFVRFSLDRLAISGWWKRKSWGGHASSAGGPWPAWVPHGLFAGGRRGSAARSRREEPQHRRLPMYRGARRQSHGRRVAGSTEGPRRRRVASSRRARSSGPHLGPGETLRCRSLPRCLTGAQGWGGVDAERSGRTLRSPPSTAVR